MKNCRDAGLLLGRTKTALFTCLFIIYPFLVYRAIASGMAWPAPTVFSVIFLWQAATGGRLANRIFKVLTAITLLLGAYYLQTITAKVMPVFIQLMLMYFFGRTLLKGGGPSFIERFVRLQFPTFPPGVSTYCRQLTFMWTGFFGFNAAVCAALAVWGTDYWWALFNGVVIYLMIGVLTAGEYIYRRFRFPGLGIPDPKSTLKSMIVNGRKVWMDLQVR